MQQLSDRIVVSTEFRRINVGAIATGSGIVCVDVPSYPREARYWRALLLEHFKEPIRYIALTDAHRDRLLGLHWFEEAQIIAHDFTHNVIKTLPGTYVDQAADAISEDSDERMSFSGVRLRLPRITFNERMTVYLGGSAVPLLAMPGPTPGNVWVHLADDGVVFTGDSVVVGQPLYMGQAHSKAWLNSLTLLRRTRFAADVVVAGRGPLTNGEATQAISGALRYMRRRVQRLYQAGRPRTDVADIVASVIGQLGFLTGQEEDVHRRFKVGLESIYDEIRQEEGRRPL